MTGADELAPGSTPPLAVAPDLGTLEDEPEGYLRRVRRSAATA